MSLGTVQAAEYDTRLIQKANRLAIARALEIEASDLWPDIDATVDGVLARRSALGISQSRLAVLAGVSPVHIRSLDRGEEVSERTAVRVEATLTALETDRASRA